MAEPMITATNLHEHELYALVVLVRVLVGLDFEFSDGEADWIHVIAGEVGEETFWRHLKESQGVDEMTVLQVMAAAKAVLRPGAQQVIYRQLAALAVSDGVAVVEKGLLARLRQIWPSAE